MHSIHGASSKRWTAITWTMSWSVDTPHSCTVPGARPMTPTLRELGAGIRVDGLAEGLRFDSTAESLRGMQMLNLRTPVGDLDLTFAPAGFPDGYDGLLPGAQPHSIGHVTVQVANLDDVIKSKTAAARPKDLDALPELIDIAQTRHKPKRLDDS